MEQGNEKTQEATPHRRQQAREQGQVARSQDLGSSLLLLGALLTLYWLSGSFIGFFGNLGTEQWGGQAWLSADSQFVTSEFLRLLSLLAAVGLPLLGVILLVAVMSNVLQVGLLFLPEKIAPDISRIDPLQGFQRLFSMAGAVRLVLGFFKIGVVAAVCFWSLKDDRDTILGLVNLSLVQIGSYLLEIIFWTVLKVAIALLLLAILDYGFQWWKQEQDLRMSTQELRDEMKNLQGDPQVISRRKAVQRQLTLHRLSKTVPQADVVVTNPTELAVALHYEPEKMAAPVVVAKGAGLLAQRIRRLALEHGIPIVEKKPLAQALYKDVDVNRPIPGPLYAAVAEVLAYVYQLNGNKKSPRDVRR